MSFLTYATILNSILSLKSHNVTKTEGWVITFSSLHFRIFTFTILMCLTKHTGPSSTCICNVEITIPHLQVLIETKFRENVAVWQASELWALLGTLTVKLAQCKTLKLWTTFCYEKQFINNAPGYVSQCGGASWAGRLRSNSGISKNISPGRLRKKHPVSYPVFLGDSSNGEESEPEVDSLISTSKSLGVWILTSVFPRPSWHSKTLYVCVHSLLSIKTI
jgi:hypothetical protein